MNLSNYPLEIGDKAEIYAIKHYDAKSYDSWVDNEVWSAAITASADYYVKKLGSEPSLAISVWTDKSEYNIGETVTIYYQTNTACTAKLTVTKPDGTQVVVGGPNDIPVCTRSKSATAGYPTGTRTVTFEVKVGSESKIATCYFDVVEDEEETKPVPKIIDVNYPTACVKEDEYATISVTVANNGGASSEGYISVSFPHDEEVPESDVSGTGNDYNKLYPKGSEIWGKDGKIPSSKDPLVELFDTDWKKDQQEIITMNVKPNSGSDEIVFYVRAALKNDADGDYERDPTYSGDKDQQGWYAKKYSVDVCDYEKVKFRGEILVDLPIISYYNFDVKIDEVLEDPTGNLQEGETVNVYGHRDGPAQVDDVTVGDEVEVYGEYRRYGGEYKQIFLSEWGDSSSDHYVKKIDEPEPDLIVENIFFSNPNPVAGELIEITAKISNVGNSETMIGLVRFYQNSYFDEPTFELDQRGITYLLGIDYQHKNVLLKPGSTAQVSVQWRAAPINNTKGENIKVVVDEFNLVDESNDDNNVAYKSINVQKSEFDISVDGYHFENYKLTESDTERIKGLIKADIESLIFPPLERSCIDLFLMNSVYAYFEIGGHCYGMSSTSILYQQDEIQKPVNKKTTFYMLKSDNGVLANINAYSAKVSFTLFDLLKYIHTKRAVDLKDEFNNIKDSIEKGTPIMLIMWGDYGCHAVVAFDMYEDKDLEYLKYVIVYDNTYPGMATVVTFNLNSNKIDYKDYKQAIAEYPAVYSGDKLAKSIRDCIDALKNYLTEHNLESIIFSCPVNATITDQYGRVISDRAINEIPNARIETFGDVKIFFIPADLIYQVNIEAYDSGEFTFGQFSPIAGNAVSITGFTDIPITENTKASVEIKPNVADYTMSIDYDGDGVYEDNISPDVNEITEQTAYSLQLYTGWNLISLPTMPEDTDILDVMNSVAGNWNSVWSYETGNWKRYDLTGPGFLNDLTTMEPGKGYWIDMKSGDTLSVSGSEPTTKSISLSAGWNLVGYNSLSSKSTLLAMNSVTGNWNSVWSYEAGNWKRYDLTGPDFLNDLTTMEPGKGYWIDMKSSDTWTLGGGLQ